MRFLHQATISLLCVTSAALTRRRGDDGWSQGLDPGDDDFYAEHHYHHSDRWGHGDRDHDYEPRYGRHGHNGWHGWHGGGYGAFGAHGGHGPHRDPSSFSTSYVTTTITWSTNSDTSTSSSTTDTSATSTTGGADPGHGHGGLPGSFPGSFPGRFPGSFPGGFRGGPPGFFRGGPPGGFPWGPFGDPNMFPGANYRNRIRPTKHRDPWVPTRAPHTTSTETSTDTATSSTDDPSSTSHNPGSFGGSGGGGHGAGGHGAGGHGAGGHGAGGHGSPFFLVRPHIGFKRPSGGEEFSIATTATPAASASSDAAPAGATPTRDPRPAVNAVNGKWGKIPGNWLHGAEMELSRLAEALTASRPAQTAEVSTHTDKPKQAATKTLVAVKTVHASKGKHHKAKASESDHKQKRGDEETAAKLTPSFQLPWLWRW